MASEYFTVSAGLILALTELFLFSKPSQPRVSTKLKIFILSIKHSLAATWYDGKLQRAAAEVNLDTKWLHREKMYQNIHRHL